jgi:hypothetical protein
VMNGEWVRIWKEVVGLFECQIYCAGICLEEIREKNKSYILATSVNKSSLMYQKNICSGNYAV